MQVNRSKDFKPFPFYDKVGTAAIVGEISKGITPLTWGDERLALYEIARGYHNEPETEGYVIEFGTNRGGTASVMASAIRDSGAVFKPLITMDIYRDHEHSNNVYTDYYLESRQVFYELGLALEYVCPIMFESYKFMDFWNQPARLIFIDTGHFYELTKLEIEKSIPHIVDDGWLVLHDYHDDLPGVIRAVNEFLDSHTEYDLEVYFAERSLVCIHLKSK